ncbi:MAG: PLDc N-terminal domain-containing protein [Pedobacter sp.]|nr:PLDc N-terminal domain-containing protein [Pedobacter sp.]
MNISIIFNFKLFTMDGLVFVYLIVAVWILLSIRAIIEISKFSYKMRMKKLIWTNLVIIFPFGGLIAYYLFGKQNLSA